MIGYADLISPDRWEITTEIGVPGVSYKNPLLTPRLCKYGRLIAVKVTFTGAFSKGGRSASSTFNFSYRSSIKGRGSQWFF
tara:strand:+ start:195 stop:437 length:243 start_codon:yes stop_codon:yes gene_type:complete